MSKSFTVNVPDPEKKFTQGMEAAAEKGVSVKGDLAGGTIEGMTPAGIIKAKYTAVGKNDYLVEILEKPFLIPASLIENKVREVLG